MHARQENHFKTFPGFSTEDGFNVAAAITAYDGKSDVIEDPEIGTIKFYIKYWNHPELGDKFGFHELDSSLCDPEKDLNDVAGTKPESGFYPVTPTNEADVNTYGPKMKCIREPYSLFGNFNSDAASTLLIIFEKCDPTKRTCKSEAEIDKWM